MRILITVFVQIILLFHGSSFAESRLLVADAQKEIAITGYTRCSKSVNICSEISGKAVNVNYGIGELTGKRPFIEIDPTFINYNIKNKKIQLKQLNTRIKELNARISLQKKQYERMVTLRNDKFVTATKMENAIQKLDSSKLELEVLNYDKDMMNVELNRLKSERSRYSISCFNGGIVTSCSIEPGEYIQAGVPIAEVSDYNTLLVQFSISEEEYKAFKLLPDKFQGTIEGKPVEASINYINPKFNEKTRKLDIEIKVSDGGFSKRGGLKFSTKVMVETDGLLIPRAAVSNRYGNPKVKKKYLDKVVSILILGESGNNLIIADNSKLSPGTELERMEPVTSN